MNFKCTVSMKNVWSSELCSDCHDSLSPLRASGSARARALFRGDFFLYTFPSSLKTTAAVTRFRRQVYGNSRVFTQLRPAEEVPSRRAVSIANPNRQLNTPKNPPQKDNQTRQRKPMNEHLTGQSSRLARSAELSWTRAGLGGCAGPGAEAPRARGRCRRLGLPLVAPAALGRRLRGVQGPPAPRRAPRGSEGLRGAPLLARPAGPCRGGSRAPGERGAAASANKGDRGGAAAAAPPGGGTGWARGVWEEEEGRQTAATSSAVSGTRRRRRQHPAPRCMAAQ